MPLVVVEELETGLPPVMPEVILEEMELTVQDLLEPPGLPTEVAEAAAEVVEPSQTPQEEQAVRVLL
tara:strand:+ start:451 stop:651 length:201 start_codon:yes stop_codon:yes gene_type:complete